MNVIKRDGRVESVKFDKITQRIEQQCNGLDTRFVDAGSLAKQVIDGLFDGVTTETIDNLVAETAASMTVKHPDYSVLAARIAISNLHKTTYDSFYNTIKRLYTYIDPKTGENASLISKDVFEVIKNNADFFDGVIDYTRDFGYDFFGYKTLERSYLLRVDGKVVERPQHLLMRVSVGIHMDNLEAVVETYNLLSERWFTHATPTLFNAGTPKPQLSSCFLLQMKDDSIDGIYDTLKQCAKISQSAGGIGLSIHNIRGTGSYIKGTNGTSNGIIPMLRVFNDTARYVDQGGGKRKGAFAIYLEPWHSDIMEFLDLKKNHGKEELRARDLFYAMWTPDLFMKRVEEDADWSLFCPNEAPGLDESYGRDFELLYEKYEKEGRARKVVKAREVWSKILESQTESGTPYMLYKDHVNNKSNQKNIGVIKSSNLCTEITEYTSPDEVAVCNLASIALPKYFDEKTKTVDHQKLYEVTKVITRNLNRIIDINYYPVVEAERSNLRHRPIGIGVQGLADLFIMLRIAFDSEEARIVNREIFETIYFAAMTSSMELAKEYGPYASFKANPELGITTDSPVAKGIFQFDMWGVNPSKRWNWTELKQNVKKYGVRNSLLLAPMPTASTSQILGNNECFEPYTSNMYARRVLSGEFQVVNKHLMKDLVDLGLWNDTTKNEIMKHRGSIQNIEFIPQSIREIYKTVWEISQKSIIDMAADRGAFICQSQSLNIFIAEPNFAKLTSMHFYAWKKGLKTGMYYLRSRPAADAVAFTVETKAEAKMPTPMAETALVGNAVPVANAVSAEVSYNYVPTNQAYLPLNPGGITRDNASDLACSLDNPDACEACGS